MSEKNNGGLKLGIIGTGTVVDTFYLPVLKKNQAFDLVYLIDKNVQRARKIADDTSVQNISRDYQDIYEHVDAAIVAVPNHLHASITEDLLNAGIHTLVEKPMANSVGDCYKMIEAANINNRILAVGLVRRYYDTNSLVKHILESDLIGSVENIEFSEGDIFNWETVTDFLFKKEKGGGVLADIGVHILDLMAWWFKDIEIVQYLDDSEGGVEANSEIKFQTQDNAEGTITLSRTRKLSNTFKIAGTKGSIEGSVRWNTPLTLKINGTVYNADLIMKEEKEVENFSIYSAFDLQLKNFFQSVIQGKVPFVSGTEGIKSIKLVDECYKKRQKLIYPWESQSKKVLENAE